MCDLSAPLSKSEAFAILLAIRPSVNIDRSAKLLDEGVRRAAVLPARANDISRLGKRGI
jgi:hypothetical protein